MMDSLDILWEQRELFLSGLVTTILLVLFAGSVSLVGGALLAVAMQAENPAIRSLMQILVDVVRSVPFLLLAYLIYYGLPQMGLRFSAWWAGALALSIYNIAYLGEIFRSAWANLSPALIETGRAFGMRRSLLIRRIILPQVFLTSAPVIGSQFIIMIKDTAFLMIITVQDITFAANFVNANYFMPFAPFALALLLYWGLCLVVELILGRVTAAADRRRHA